MFVIAYLTSFCCDSKFPWECYFDHNPIFERNIFKVQNNDKKIKFYENLFITCEGKSIKIKKERKKKKREENL